MSRWGLKSWLSIVFAVITLLIIIDVAQEEEPLPGTKEWDALSIQRKGGELNEEVGTKNNTESLESLTLEKLVRENAELKTTNPFSPSTWYRPPPRPKLPPPPPPPPYVAPVPTAPPLPFQYFGSYEDGPKRIVLLLKGDQIYTLTEGDSIDSTYQIQAIEGNKIEMIYLPLGITQTIDTGVNAFSARNQKRGK